MGFKASQSKLRATSEGLTFFAVHCISYWQIREGLLLLKINEEKWKKVDQLRTKHLRILTQASTVRNIDRPRGLWSWRWRQLTDPRSCSRSRRSWPGSQAPSSPGRPICGPACWQSRMPRCLGWWIQSLLHMYSSKHHLTSVHGQQLVIAKEFCNILLIFAQDIVVKGPGGECQDVCLISQGLHNLRMAVALIHR